MSQVGLPLILEPVTGRVEFLSALRLTRRQRRGPVIPRHQYIARSFEENRLVLVDLGFLGFLVLGYTFEVFWIQ